ncbi:hypothetical protein GCM10023313_05300 [Mucilaginibacter defluvii]|uniref:Uncharacterized protein n=1 Tax=Mucilaginibacter defluvii TaxID=1196019 RepID=A0ABP9FNH7_9SPHI
MASSALLSNQRKGAIFCIIVSFYWLEQIVYTNLLIAAFIHAVQKRHIEGSGATALSQKKPAQPSQSEGLKSKSPVNANKVLTFKRYKAKFIPLGEDLGGVHYQTFTKLGSHYMIP